MGQLPSPSDQDDLLGRIVSQADLFSIFSRPDEESRRDVTTCDVLKDFLMAPGSKLPGAHCPR